MVPGQGRGWCCSWCCAACWTPADSALPSLSMYTDRPVEPGKPFSGTQEALMAEVERLQGRLAAQVGGSGWAWGCWGVGLRGGGGRGGGCRWGDWGVLHPAGNAPLPA